jgi:hypothetical protein
VRTEVAAIVDRLLQSRSPPWLQVLDAAELDRPVEQEAAPERIVAPYRCWSGSARVCG